ncbi:MAG: hypothetical protein Q8M35_01115 [Pseudohongiella sp.]|nr:hypothetical protein [Pseudohongiella sp.]
MFIAEVWETLYIFRCTYAAEVKLNSMFIPMGINALRLLTIAACTLAPLTCHAAETPLIEFKGISIGSKTADLPDNWRCEYKKTKFSDTVCTTYKETIAGSPAKLGIVYALDYKVNVISILFGSSEYQQIKLALIEKYGMGDVKDSEVTNKMGARFNNQTVTWTDSANVMTLSKRSGNVDRGDFTIRSTTAVSELRERMESESKANAKDL